ncbi:MAG: hypothetical protein AAFX80_21675 [Cyanobacteria bacterium J06639_18]|uniref:hypothetical protein n=1 Tax=Mastigocoleus sp. MO_188.B34 TaxID=3036635 RepID=UPI00261E03FA|nr:hypothetical protein [Mastigocoleus sp. MO_188.B34]MDJ0692988.1 hypothetical protein [Mastigocoleus sp. MO_188.B34]
MTTQDKARALMMQHYHQIKNRQQSMLERVVEEIGLPKEIADYWQPIQGKISPSVRISCDRSHASMS